MVSGRDRQIRCDVPARPVLRQQVGAEPVEHGVHRPAGPLARPLGRLGSTFVERRAVAEQLHRSDTDLGALEHQRPGRTSGDRDQPAPVRIAAVHRGLHQQRVGDRPRGGLGVVVGPGAGDADPDQLGCTFAAADDIDRQRLADLLERGDDVVGLDIVNDYYDPVLKEARLKELAKTAAASGASFVHERSNLADKASSS